MKHHKAYILEGLVDQYWIPLYILIGGQPIGLGLEARLKEQFPSVKIIDFRFKRIKTKNQLILYAYLINSESILYHDTIQQGDDSVVFDDGVLNDWPIYPPLPEKPLHEVILINSDFLTWGDLKQQLESLGIFNTTRLDSIFISTGDNLLRIYRLEDETLSIQGAGLDNEENLEYT